MDNSIFLQMDCFYDCFFGFGRTSASVVTVLIFLFVSSLQKLFRKERGKEETILRLTNEPLV